MYEADQKFLNADGSINYAVAIAAGREARARATHRHCRIVRDQAVRVISRLRDAMQAWRAETGYRVSTAPTLVAAE